MTTDSAKTTGPISTEQRLERLERTVARLRWLFMFVVIAYGAMIAALGWLVDERNSPSMVVADYLRVKGFEVVDDTGYRRAGLGVADGTVLFALRGTNGVDRITASVDEQFSTVNFTDQKGRWRMGLSAAPDGPILMMMDDQEVVRAILRVGKDGPHSYLVNTNGLSVKGIRRNSQEPPKR